MTVYQQVLNGIQEMGYGEFIVDSDEAAKASGRKKNIVLVEEDEGLCSLYLTFDYHGSTGEFVSWNAMEFEDEPDLVSIMLNAVSALYHYPDEVLERELDKERFPNTTLVPNFSMYFHTYDDELEGEMDMTPYQEILEGIKEMGFGHLVVSSHEEAKQNNRKKNIILIEDNELCDIYLTYKYQGEIGEFVCWVSDEFEGEPNLVDIILNAVEEFYSYSEKELDEDLIPNNRLVPGFNSY